MVYPFHITALLENQITNDAEQYHRCQKETGNPIDKPEESPETDDSDRRPYWRYVSWMEIVEHDERDNT